VGKGGLMYSTSDASTWTKTALTASQSIYGLSASTVNSVFGAWICGESGMVMSHNVSAATVQDYTQINNIKIELFPNPASDMLRIKNSIELSNLNFIEFYNVLGDKVLEYPVNANNNIDNYEFNVQGLNSGIYIIKLYSNSASYSVRMVKN